MDNNTVISIDAAGGADFSTVALASSDLSITGDLSICSTIATSNNYHWQNPGNLVLGENSSDGSDSDIYICEKWESKKPIKIKEGMFASFKDDLYSLEEIQEIVYNKIEEEYPEKAIKIGLNKETLKVRKHSLPIEIKIKD